MYCTQCEAEGFRRITLMQDRPDVMATSEPPVHVLHFSLALWHPVLTKERVHGRYKVRIEADKATAPILLSNGNLTNSVPSPAAGSAALKLGGSSRARSRGCSLTWHRSSRE
eukprot:2516778-Rhodomonas_salina.2